MQETSLSVRRWLVVYQAFQLFNFSSAAITGTLQNSLQPLTFVGGANFMHVISVDDFPLDFAQTAHMKARCLDFASALGLGSRRGAHANETKALELLKKGEIFPVQDTDERISCRYVLAQSAAGPATIARDTAFIDLAALSSSSEAIGASKVIVQGRSSACEASFVVSFIVFHLVWFVETEGC